MRMPQLPEAIDLDHFQLSRICEQAFLRKALQPEFYRCRVWLVYGTHKVTAIPEPVLTLQNAHIFSGLAAGSYDLTDPANPGNKRIQVAFDLLEKFTKSVVVMAEVLDEQWIARCSAWHMNCTDETDWHTHEDLKTLMWELIDAHGNPASVEEFRPK